MDDYNLPWQMVLAKRQRNRSNHRRKVGAILTFKGRVSATGYNKQKTHPKFADGIKVFSIHAEMDALIHSKSEIKGDEVWVYREAANRPAMAKPCEYCMKHLIEIGIKTIYYTVPYEPWYERINL